jgi:AcrR family transcriptional regulator
MLTGDPHTTSTGAGRGGDGDTGHDDDATAYRPETPGRRYQNDRQDRRGRTREALLNAAQRLWAERGIRGASLDDIAGAAGLTKGAVYSNFTGKTDLLLALLDRHTAADIGPELSPALQDPERPLAERCAAAGDGFTEWLAGDEARLVSLLLVEFWLYGMRDFAAGWRIAEWYDMRRAHIAEQFPQGPAPDGLSAEDRATLTMALDLGLAIQHLLDPDRVAPATYSAGLQLLLAGATPGD